ncbi:Transcriptional regulator GlxA family, contains an amidase domain and an AraC-type DNA-binding HTH domain [Oceanospirillum multiglobuliferum]|uniref:AraC family transcriptional regulator n=1 Tax=Oceanospirillum multiglobuliferum TaxID=64969 RepID=A0A1T4PCL3_9GAMM|nr:GlxA family transcriptional regulator [Oceanospirillum multiglobuliferum]OPX55617.1 AraC family transcriptional regulator [Oceanospirillum multiglobuliferum]SJZ88936.1 Transcriptional regulator GlxA family, contains an amidase domain and an AraC-type DNA-binding HTH domain [Oceanospirillum multiglobuliferum]
MVSTVDAQSKQSRPPLKYGFLLLPNFSLIAFSSAIEPLRMANWVTGDECYETILISHDGEPVASSFGVKTIVDCSLDNIPMLDAVFVCGASPIARTGNDAIIAWLRKQRQSGMAIGGIGTGSYLLACAGLLNNHKATIHWWDIESLREDFPLTQVTNNLFEIDNKRYTCSGGTAAMDMMLFLISQRHNMDLAASISEQFVCERMRASDDQQRIPLKARIGVSQPKLIEAVQLIEANIEEPLSADDLARHVGVSRRHLERLFKKHLQTVPSKYYLELRLDRARQMLRRTDKSVLQVGLACGFSSASHFSTAYRSHYGLTPREERKKLSEVESHELNVTSRSILLENH